MAKQLTEMPEYILINEIRKLPAAFIGGKSIERLDAFVCGWCHAQNNQNCDQFWLNFSKWIRIKYDIQSSHSWSGIIKFQFQDDHLALKKFFTFATKYAG